MYKDDLESWRFMDSVMHDKEKTPKNFTDKNMKSFKKS